MFLTVAAVRIREDSALEFLEAGHLPILHYRAADDSVVSLTTRQLGVGIQADFRLGSDSTRLQVGDCLLLATDGVTEVEDQRGTPFGMERLAELLRNQHSRPAKEVDDLLRSRVAEHGPQRDDQTLMIIRCTEQENCSANPRT